MRVIEIIKNIKRQLEVFYYLLVDCGMAGQVSGAAKEHIVAVLAARFLLFNVRSVDSDYSRL